MPGWRFLTNHALVLLAIAKQPRITAREIALAVGITERATHNIITDLDTGGYIAKKREGRGIRYRINPDLPLRHELTDDRAVGDLLEILGWKRRKKRLSRKALLPMPPASQLRIL